MQGKEETILGKRAYKMPLAKGHAQGKGGAPTRLGSLHWNWITHNLEAIDCSYPGKAPQ